MLNNYSKTPHNCVYNDIKQNLLLNIHTTESRNPFKDLPWSRICIQFLSKCPVKSLQTLAIVIIIKVCVPHKDHETYDTLTARDLFTIPRGESLVL